MRREPPNRQKIESTKARCWWGAERHSNSWLNQERSANDHKPVLPICPKGLRCSLGCIDFIDPWNNPQTGCL
jgi:hypothetical protein